MSSPAAPRAASAGPAAARGPPTRSVGSRAVPPNSRRRPRTRSRDPRVRRRVQNLRSRSESAARRGTIIFLAVSWTGLARRPLRRDGAASQQWRAGRDPRAPPRTGLDASDLPATAAAIPTAPRPRGRHGRLASTPVAVLWAGARASCGLAARSQLVIHDQQLRVAPQCSAAAVPMLPCHRDRQPPARPTATAHGADRGALPATLAGGSRRARPHRRRPRGACRWSSRRYTPERA